jgi:hypothetical protein
MGIEGSRHHRQRIRTQPIVTVDVAEIASSALLDAGIPGGIQSWPEGGHAADPGIGTVRSRCLPVAPAGTVYDQDFNRLQGLGEQ